MDFSTISTTAGNNGKRESGEWLRGSPATSSSLTRRPGFRRKETFDNVVQKENSQRYSGINGAHKKEDTDIGYQGQTRTSSFQNRETDVGYQKPTALHQKSTTSVRTYKSGTADKESPELKSQSQTEWWGRSMDRRTRGTNLAQGTRVDISTSSAKPELDLNKHDNNLRERTRSETSFINRVQSFPKSFKPGTYQHMSSGNHTSQTLNEPDLGHSLPFIKKPDSGPNDVPEGGQSIQERIERLFGSAGEKSEWGTFPRRFSTVESKTSVQRRASFICYQKGTDSSDAETSHCLGTKSLDRARSRHTIANQIRSDRAAGGVTAVTCLRKENRLYENEENSPVNGMLGERVCKPQEQEEAKGNIVLNAAHDQDVFHSNLKKKKTEDGKKLSEGLTVPTSASVKNKIKQFEALAQKAVSRIPFPRWTFSVSKQDKGSDGLKKSKSAKDIAGQKEMRLKEMTNGIKATAAEEKRLSERSLSADEGGQKWMSRAIEPNYLIENKNKPFEDFRLCRKLNKMEYNGSEEHSRKSGKDQMDFFKESNPEESSQRDMASQEQPKKLPPAVGENKSQTNFFKGTLLISPLNQTVKASPTAEKNRSPSVLTQAFKSLDVDSPLGPLPSTTSSQSSLTDPLPVHMKTPNMGRKHMRDLTAWVAGLDPGYKWWNDEGSVFDDDDQSTQRDEDSNYDSDSGGSSVTITSNLSQSDRCSFSVSLSELCNFAGPDIESDDEEDNWESVSRRSASVSSDMSVFSCVSMLATEELDRLLEDVRTVEDDNVKDFEDVQVVVLHKEVGVGLGFSLAGGVDQNKPVTVHKVFPLGVAAQEGSITEGDKVLSINGSSFKQSTHREALDVLKKAKSRSMGVVVLRRDEVRIAARVVAPEITEDAAQAEPETGRHVCVQLQKNSKQQLGFSLHGGVGSSEGNIPLTVKKIFQGGPVDKVFPGDEVLEIDGMSMVAMRCLEAWNFIKKLPQGSVEVVLRRPLKYQQT